MVVGNCISMNRCFLALMTASILFLQLASATWLLSFNNKSDGRTLSAAVPSNASLNELTASIERLEIENKVAIKSFELVAESVTPKASHNDLQHDSKRKLCDFSLSLEATLSLFDSHSLQHSINGSKQNIVLLLHDACTQERYDLLVSKFFGNSRSRQWQITAIYHVNDVNIKKHVRALASTNSHVFFMDLPVRIADMFLGEAYNFGLKKKFAANLWLLSSILTKELSLLYNVPRTLIVGFKVKAKDGVHEVFNDGTQCHVEANRSNAVEILQLLSNMTHVSEKSWRKIGQWKNGTLNVDIVFKLSHALPRLKIVTGPTYMPYMHILKNEDNLFCNLNGLRGYFYENPASNVTTEMCAYGSDVDYIKHFMEQLGFQAELYMARNGTWGRNGALGEVNSGLADLALSLFVTRDTDSSLAYFDGMAIASVKKTNFRSMDITSPFTTTVWLCLTGIFATSAVVLWLLEVASPYGNFQKNKRRLNNLKSFKIYDSINYLWGLVVCGELIAVKPRSTGAKMLALFFSYFAIAFTMNYTGNIIASFVSDADHKQVSGLKDPELVQKNVKVAAIKGSHLWEQLTGSSDESLQKLYNALLVVESFDSGFDALITGKLDYFIADTRSLKYMAAISGFCKMNTVPVTEFRFPIAIGFRKGLGGWKQQIKDEMVNMIESGVYDEETLVAICLHQCVYLGLKKKRLKNDDKNDGNDVVRHKEEGSKVKCVGFRIRSSTNSMALWSTLIECTASLPIYSLERRRKQMEGVRKMSNMDETSELIVVTNTSRNFLAGRVESDGSKPRFLTEEDK
eukprot:gene17611-19365_t